MTALENGSVIGGNFCSGQIEIELGSKNTSSKIRRRMEKKSETQQEKKLCKRCNQSYTPSSNTPSSCRFHPSFFVCRRHDDQKRYYELGPNDPPYAAKFYDCCGAEDPQASGCTTSFHVSYDDD
ncbi:uncharacterized protein LOC133855312 [Alnus glutinosa]|uniref:uncharacterized protein LOC133855312 n=1 Tax=Alnus glutinosa TaxID=3517 RepID=UPI002D78F6B0|nr:uncharacterized protein LOC133855312 [Alnus glutinosa]